MNDKTMIIDFMELNQVFKKLARLKSAGLFIERIIAIQNNKNSYGFLEMKMDWVPGIKGYQGKPVCQGAPNAIMPTVTILPEAQMFTIRLDVHNQSFTQYSRVISEWNHKTTKGIMQHLLSVIHRRCLIANDKPTDRIPGGTGNFIMSLEFLEEVLKKGKVVKKQDTWEVVTELENHPYKNPEEIIRSGVLLSCTTSWFNKTKREEVVYYVVEACGQISEFTDMHKDFSFHSRLGYLALGFK